MDLGRLFDDYPYWSESLVSTIGEERQGVPLALNSIQVQVNAIEEAAQAQGIRKALILKARRTGITTHEQNRAIWECWRGENVRCLTLAHTQEDTAAIFRDVAQYQYNSIPADFRPALENESTRSLVLKQNRSRLTIATAGGKSPGRGGTLNRVHVSEAAYVSPKLMPNLRAGLHEAARRGFYVEESTANGCQGDFYATCRSVMESGERFKRIAKIGRNGWVMIFLPWFLDLRNARHTEGQAEPVPGIPRQGEDGEQVDGERELIEHAAHEYGHIVTPGQLNWRRWKLADPPARRLFAQEYPATPDEAFLSSGHSRFNGRAVNLGRMACRPPIREHTDAMGHLQVWEEPDPRLAYLLAADTSAGVPGDDPQVWGIFEPRSFRQVAAWRGYMTTRDFGLWCVEWAANYNDALLVVERNNHGHAVLDAIIDTAEYGRTYYAADGKRGWETSTKTRPLMVDDLADAVDRGELAGLVSDPQFWRECPTFVRQPNGKYAATEGGENGDHDDVIIMTAMAFQTRKDALHVPTEQWDAGGLLGMGA